VVRINPNELHFSDPEFYEEIYHGKKYKTHRDTFYNLRHLGGGLAFTLDHDVHARRRQALSQYFSMQSIRALEPRIQDVVQRMIDNLVQARESGKIINLYYLFSGFAFDIVAEYAFGAENGMKYLSRSEYGKEWADLTQKSIHMNSFSRQFPSFFGLMLSMPETVVSLALHANMFLCSRRAILYVLLDRSKRMSADNNHEDELAQS
jgi:cytochrome P450